MMRRTVTLRTTLHALIAAPLLLTALPARAEEAPSAIVSIVTGLAPGDLLNIRAKPSPIGKTETRLANGSSVKNLGCNDVDGHQWCKVEDLDNPKVGGWTPARYLNPINPAAVADAALPAETTPAQAPVTIASSETGEASPLGTQPPGTQAVVATTSEGTAPEAASPATAPNPPTAPAPDLTARLGGADHATNPEATLKSAAAIGKVAIEDAYRLAFAANENPSTGEIQDSATEEKTAETPDALAAAAVSQPAAEAAAPATGAIPVPTPRPDRARASPAIDPQIVARVEPPQAPAHAADATGEIPCARYVGQPMARCGVSVVRSGADKADVTVTWPDGGTRVISFYAGQPAGSNSRSDFRFTREGNLSMIRVGVSERFEITDQLALGD
jgi:hypothetical protein